MRIDLLYFHKVREATGRRDDAVSLPDGSTVGHALEHLTTRCPGLVPLLPSLMTAVNEELASRDRVLHDGDRLALMPPFSGG